MLQTLWLKRFILWALYELCTQEERVAWGTLWLKNFMSQALSELCTLQVNLITTWVSFDLSILWAMYLMRYVLSERDILWIMYLRMYFMCYALCAPWFLWAEHFTNYALLKRNLMKLSWMKLHFTYEPRSYVWGFKTSGFLWSILVGL